MKKIKIPQHFARYVSLNILGMMGLSCYILADTFFVSRALGSVGLAALNISISVYSFVSALGLMLGIGGATRYSILISQGEEKKASSLFSSTMLTAAISGLIIALIGLFFSEKMASLLGANADTLPLSTVYLRTLLGFSPFFLMNNVLLAFVRNDGSPQLGMAGMMLGSLANILLDYVFMFPLGMGMFGAALATGIAPILSLITLSFHFRKQERHLRFTRKKLDLKAVLSCLPLGLSSFIAEMSSGVVLVVFNLQILRLAGNIGVAAYGIIANVSLVCIAVFTGIAQGIQPLTSAAYGRGDVEELRAIRRASVLLALILSVTIYALSFIFTDGIISIFNSEQNAALLPLAREGIRVYFLGFFFAGINIVVAAFMSACAKPRAGFAVSITRGCAAVIPLALLLPFLLGLSGVWLAFVLAELCAFVIALIVSRRKNAQ